ncbi:3-phosphoshikimate 1-carboxyvinyltransferase [Candidatus Bathycorpusculum sp.]|uniref:3-phosphoshikimate 1-carboxyvinyltransferase n=1 Tax=Candidatus Bathycorpusculum sp. TaxID=2994959 RepID=UPI002838F02A|nr:3-phosphoshikimate 1-carboxyvinyltransferase [Candidatus Termitimicrobium sp.]MCL2432276.1 3-phosphoshikimate 1-carboxyvinyltransferase [Candidatus Termitimicrobium sp.]
MEVTIKKTSGLCGEVAAPASKSYTQRMIIAAALSQGNSKVWSPLLSQDTQASLRAVTAFGAEVEFGEKDWVIQGAQSLRAPIEPVDCGESGATLRFMIPIAALAEGASTLLFRGSLMRRPVEPLLAALGELGVEAQVGKHEGLDAVFVEGGGIAGGKAFIAGDISSQFISGLMFACPLARAETEITLTKSLESKDYVEMTQAVLSKHAVIVEVSDDHIRIPGNQVYKAVDSRVPGDFSSAAFLLAASAIGRAQVTVNNLDYEGVQGDKAIFEVLKRMGVEGRVGLGRVEIQSRGGPLKAIDIDARNIPDLVPVIAVLACYAEGTSHIWGAKRLRLKESDRLQAIYVELGKMGAEIQLTQDGLNITGAPLHGAVIDAHNDHRIAMAACVAALGAEGETLIQQAECIRKSYPQFYLHLKQLGADIVGGKLDR